MNNILLLHCICLQYMSAAYRCPNGCGYSTPFPNKLGEHISRSRGLCGNEPLFQKVPPSSTAAPAGGSLPPASTSERLLEDSGHDDAWELKSENGSEGSNSESDDLSESSSDDEVEFTDEELRCMKISNHVINEKLTNASTETLLDLLRSLGLDVPFRHADEVREYLRSFVPSSSLWRTEMLQVEGFSAALPVFYIDLECWLVREYGSKERGDGFQLRAEHFNFSNPPCEEAWQTSVWQREEAALIADEGEDAYMAGLELSSDATAVNFKGRSLHPLYANLRNRPTKVKTSSYDTVAYFAHIKRPRTMPKPSFRMVKLRYMHAALQLILRPLIHLGWFGQEMLDPTGVCRRVYPRLLAVIADMKEKWELMCLYGNGKVNRPCPICQSTKGAMKRMITAILGGIECVPSRYRSESQQLEIVNLLESDPNLGKKWSTHPVASGLYGLPGVVDIHEKIPHETMHSNSLGFTLKIVEAIAPYAESIGQRKESVAATIDDRLMQIPRYYNLRLPLYDDEYVLGHAFVQAQGHRAVCRMLPFLLQGLLDAHFLALVIAWEQFQQLCHGERRPGGLTQDVAEQIRASGIRLVILAHRVLPSKALASIKFHCILEHAWRDVLNHGNPYNHDAQGSERAHAKPKALYRQTNKQETGYSYMKSMLKRDEAEAGHVLMSREFAKRQCLEDHEGESVSEVVEHHNETAYMQVSRTGAHTLQATSTCISLAGLEGLTREAAPKSVSDKCWVDTHHLLSKQKELSCLPKLFKQHLFMREFPTREARRGRSLADVLHLVVFFV